MSTEQYQNETLESHAGKDNHNFVQVTRHYMSQLRALTKKNPLATEILLYFVEHMGRTTNAVICSYRTLEEITGSSRATVGRALKILRDDRWIEAVKIGTATAYAVNAQVFWQSARNQKRYAVFQATVIASENEQDADYAESSRKPLKNIPIIGEVERVLLGSDPLPPPDQQDLPLD